MGAQALELFYGQGVLTFHHVPNTRGFSLPQTPTPKTLELRPVRTPNGLAQSMGQHIGLQNICPVLQLRGATSATNVWVHEPPLTRPIRMLHALYMYVTHHVGGAVREMSERPAAPATTRRATYQDTFSGMNCLARGQQP